MKGNEMLWVILTLLIVVIILLVAVWLRLRPEKTRMKQDEPPKVCWWFPSALIFALLAILAGVLVVGYFVLGPTEAFSPEALLRGQVYFVMSLVFTVAFVSFFPMV
jgi:small-conductance mechanosensitive channel